MSDANNHTAGVVDAAGYGGPVPAAVDADGCARGPATDWNMPNPPRGKWWPEGEVLLVLHAGERMVQLEISERRIHGTGAYAVLAREVTEKKPNANGVLSNGQME
jgi:hypothetical protein